MAQKFRVQEIKVKSGLSNRSGIITENMTSSTADKFVGTTFKSVLVNENGEFVVGGASIEEVVYKTANYTITGADKGKVIAFDTTSGALTATLPNTGLVNGDKIYIKVHKGANKLTVNTSGGQTIDNTVTTFDLEYADGKRSGVELVYDGAGKFQAVLDFSGKLSPAIVYINKIFVSNGSANSVKVYNLTTNTVEATISTANPYASRANNQKTRMIVPGLSGGGFSIIDMTTNTLVGGVYQSGGSFYSGSFHPTENKLFVPRETSSAIYVYDYSSMTLLTTITPPHGSNQNYSCISPDGTKLFVCSSTAGASPSRVDVYNTTTYAHITAITGIGSKAYNIVADNTHFYVLLDFDRVLKKYTHAGVLQRTSPVFSAGSYCEGLDLSPDGTYLAVCNTTNVYKVDASTGNHLANVGGFSSGAGAQSTSFRGDGTKLYVGDNLFGNTVKEITTSSRTITATFSGGFSQIESIIYV